MSFEEKKKYGSMEKAFEAGIEAGKLQDKKMYSGHAIVVRTGQAREILTSTDKPFDWFPELEKLFENFKIKGLEIEIENTEEGITRKFFKIIKEK